MKWNIRTALLTLIPVKLLALLNNVQAKLQGSTVYTDPPVQPADMATLAEELEDAIEGATDGTRMARAQRDKLVVRAQDVLRTTADYVRMVANGDLELLAQSGFPIAKQRQPAGPVGVPLLKEARMTGRPGQVELLWGGVVHRKAYNVYVTDQDPGMPGAKWQAVGVTSRVRFMVEDLEPYKPYWFCVSALGALGEGLKSDAMLGRAA